MKKKKKRLQIKKILVPTDFSEESEYAVNYAVLLAKKLQSRILLVHVIEPYTYSVSDAIQVIDHYTALKSIARSMLDDLQKKLLKEGVKTDVVVMKGSPYLEIVKRARQTRVDLIILGTHGRTGVQRFLVGSVAERVIRLASCPVLTAKG